METPVQIERTGPRPAVVRELPATLYLESTNRCDSLCETCIRTFQSLEPPRDMSFEEMKGVVDQVPTLRRAALHGIGEPLLNPDLFRMIEYLKARGVAVILNSDAISLNARKRELLLAAGPDEYRVSMDAATPETYLKIRGVPQFHRVVENVAALTALQRERALPAPRVSLWFVGIKANITELPEFVRLAEKVGAAEVYLQRLVFYGTGLAVEDQSLYGKLRAVEEAMVAEAQALADRAGVGFRASGGGTPLASLTPQERARPWAGCQRPWTLAYVTANGNVLPCCISPWTARDYAGLILGNAYRQPFAEIWNGPGYRQFREQFETDVAPDPCRGCGMLWSY